MMIMDIYQYDNEAYRSFLDLIPLLLARNLFVNIAGLFFNSTDHQILQPETVPKKLIKASESE